MTTLPRPTLLLQTVYFHPDDQKDALDLGIGLYNRLTRPLDDPLAFGPGIPVRVAVAAEHVDLKAAETTIIIPVMGSSSAQTLGDEIPPKLALWHKELGPGHVLPVLMDNSWSASATALPTPPLRTWRRSTDDAWQQTMDEIVLAIANLWGKGKIIPFISYDNTDLPETDGAAKEIFDFIATDVTGKKFFDTASLQPGVPLTKQMMTSAGRGVFIAVQGDDFASRIWCQKELLTAKLYGLPKLTVQILRQGEARSYPYCGNGQTVIWASNPAQVASQAMTEWLRAVFFRKEAARIRKAANLPDDLEFSAQPPELLDLAQGPLRFESSRLVLHPDPELNALERSVLKAAQPRMHLVTPTTAFRRLFSRRDGDADLSAPLEGMQVALSLSDLPGELGVEGITDAHLQDATVFIARTLVACGATIAYGGDFREPGYTLLLARLIQKLIQGYNQSARQSSHRLHSYLAAHVKLRSAPPGLVVQAHALSEPKYRPESLLPPPDAPGAPPSPLYFSDMRHFMESHMGARIIIGGTPKPRLENGGPGYGGWCPGVVEEAWRTLEAGHPLYVVGGFGGAAALVADLLEGDGSPASLPLDLREASWTRFPAFADRVRELNSEQNRPHLEKLGLPLKPGQPLKMDDLAQAVMDLGRPLLADAKTSLERNGLTPGENLQLFRSRDCVTIAALISKGLLNVARRKARNKLQIELVLDSITAARNLDAIAIATIEDVPLAGAGAALDQVTGGRATLAHSQGLAFASLQHSHIDAGWLLMASLGKLGDPRPVTDRIRHAAEKVAWQLESKGFQRVGMVLFGGTLLTEVIQTAEAMIAGLDGCKETTAIVLYEKDEQRFETLRKAFAANPGVSLTTQRPQVSPIPAATAPRSEPFIVSVRLEGNDLITTSLVPAGTASLPVHRQTLSPDSLEKLCQGVGIRQRRTPDMTALRTRGRELARLLWGPYADAVLTQCRSSRFMVIHDTPASQIPFELLLSSADEHPALNGGLIRRIEVTDLPPDRLFKQPPKKGQLKVLLVTDPNDNLPQAVAEAKSLRAFLEAHKQHVDVTELPSVKATPAEVAAALATADVFHFCGHGFYDGPAPEESGLILAGASAGEQVRFTAADIRQISPLPRMAFVNACEVGRVRGAVSSTVSFAEIFLRSGIDAYLGPYWEVDDHAAASFATSVYTSLAIGHTLESAVLQARKTLHNGHSPKPDWANYRLFGGEDFRLIVEPQVTHPPV